MDSLTCKIAQQKQRRDNILNSYNFICDTTSSSDPDSEIGYASDEKEFSLDKYCPISKSHKRSRQRRKRTNRKGKLDVNTKHDLFLDESDTTLDAPILRRTRTSKQLNKSPLNENAESSYIPERETVDAITSSKVLPSNANRKRNGSKSSWTDSGVSMSQPSTLGEHSHQATLPEETSHTPINEKKFNEKLRREILSLATPGIEYHNDQSTMNASEHTKICYNHQEISNDTTKTRLKTDHRHPETIGSSEKSPHRSEKLSNRTKKDHSSSDITPYVPKQQINLRKTSCHGDLVVALVSKDVKQRSRSVTDYQKQEPRLRRLRSDSVPTNECTNVPIQLGRITNEKGNIAKEDGVKSDKLEKKHPRLKENGIRRHPEIIKKDRKDLKNYEEKQNDMIQSTKSPSDCYKILLSENIEKAKEDEEHYTEKESQIIEQLIDNAKAEIVKKVSVQSTSSSESSMAENTSKKTSKLQRLKDVLKIKRKTSVNKDMLSPSSVHVEQTRKLTTANNEQNHIYDFHHHCQNQFCFCDVDDDQSNFHENNPLQHLGRDVISKKKKFLSKLFRFSSNSSKCSNQPSGATRMQKEQDCKPNWKRSGSTRSLPESLRQMWLWTQSPSIENMKSQFQINRQRITKLNFKRSTSNHSIYNCQVCCHLSDQSCQRHEALSPPSPFRRSKSLRSLSGNYDIATHLLQTKDSELEQTENNNLFCHPYFEGHTTRDVEHIPQEVSLSTYTENNEEQRCDSLYDDDNSVSDKHSSKNLINYPRNNNRDQLATEIPCSLRHYQEPVDPNHVSSGCCYDNIPHFRDKQLRPSLEVMTIAQEDDGMVMAPLQVTIMHEKHAGKVQLRGTTFKSFV